MSERTLKALADHDEIGPLMPIDGGNCEVALSRFAQSGIDIDDLSAELQEQDAASSVNSRIELMSMIASKSAALWQAS